MKPGSKVRRRYTKQLLIQNCQLSVYPELSVVHAQIATHSPMMADLSEQCWWKGVFTRVLKELLQLERFTATMMGKQKITTYKTRTWRSKSYGLFFFHPLLGNEDVEMTAKLFAFNRFTFQNWISQPRYFCKWVEYRLRWL